MAFPFRGYFVLEQQTSYVRRNALLVAAMLLCGADALVRSRTPWSGFCSIAPRPTRPRSRGTAPRWEV